MKTQISEQLENTSYNYSTLSGQAVLEVSGAVKLHSVIISRGTSGQFFTLFDSAISGRFLSAGVSVVGVGYCGSGNDNPSMINYDVALRSGLVIVSSGQTWLMSATYK